MKFWEIIADNLSKAGWSWGCVSTIDCGSSCMLMRPNEKLLVRYGNGLTD
jgi:hypothetical protein